MNHPDRHHHLAVLTTLLLAASGLTLQSCGDNSCYDNGSSLPLAVCYMDGIQHSVPGLTIKGIDVPGDSLLADSNTVSEIYLPLRASVNTTSYELLRWVELGGETKPIYDTLTLDYEPVVYFHSSECGAMYNFNIKKVTCTGNAIDSVVLLTQTVTNSVLPAMRIYFTNF